MKGFKARNVEELKKMDNMELERYKEQARQEIYAEAYREPLLWFPHDSKAHEDKDVRDLLVLLGPEGYGRFWLLMEELSSNPDHYINLQRPSGWRVVMDCTHCKSQEEAKTLLDTLAELELICSSSYNEGLVSNERMEEQVYSTNVKLAQGRFGTFSRELKRQISIKSEEKLS